MSLPSPSRDRSFTSVEGTSQNAASVPPSAAVPVPEPPADVIFIVRHDGIVLFVNRPLGPHGEDEVIGTPFTDWIFPEQHGEVRTALDRVARTRRPSGLELKGIQRHAPEAMFECRLSSNGEGGATLSITVVARDVTRFRRALAELATERDDLRRQLEERTADLVATRHTPVATADAVATLFEAAGEAVFVLDPADGAIVDANETGCRWLRTERTALRGRHPRTLDVGFPLALPEGFDVTFTETRDSRRPVMLTGVHRRQDGSSFPVEVALARHETQAGLRLLAVVRDVKHRQHADDQLRDAAARYAELRDLVDIPVFATARAGEIVEANAAAAACLGYEVATLLGRDARELLPRTDDVRAFQRGMAEHGKVDALVVEIRRADGSVLPATVSAVRRMNARGAVQGYLWLLAPGAPEHGTVAPESSAVAPGPHPLVLLADGDARRRAERYDLLSRSGCVVVEAGSIEEAIEAPASLRDKLVTVVVQVGVDPESERPGLLALRRLVPAARLVLVGDADGPARVLAAGLGATALTEPAHPLALIQAVKPLTD